MGWFSETAGERYARLNGENTQRMQQGARERDDINYQRSQEAAYQRQNWQHKTMTFEAEQRLARSEGRYPIYTSPAQVPDMIRVNDGKSSSDWSMAPIAIIAAVILLVVSIVWSVFALLASLVFAALRIALLLLVVGAAGLTVTWLVMHFTAGTDPAKVHRAKLFHPVRVAKVLASLVAGLFKDRKTRKASKRQAKRNSSS